LQTGGSRDGNVIRLFFIQQSEQSQLKLCVKTTVAFRRRGSNVLPAQNETESQMSPEA
jgi:hypothetical protein